MEDKLYCEMFVFLWRKISNHFRVPKWTPSVLHVIVYATNISRLWHRIIFSFQKKESKFCLTENARLKSQRAIL